MDGTGGTSLVLLFKFRIPDEGPNFWLGDPCAGGKLLVGLEANGCWGDLGKFSGDSDLVAGSAGSVVGLKAEEPVANTPSSPSAGLGRGGGFVEGVIIRFVEGVIIAYFFLAILGLDDRTGLGAFSCSLGWGGTKVSPASELEGL